MRILIIEDEKPAARRLERLLSGLGFQTEAMLYSVKESIQWMMNNPHPDLILLDIQLSDGLSFEIFEEVDVKSAIIFTTAYDEYALKAFKLNSVDYLLKPIDEDELKTAIEKFKGNRAQSSDRKFDLELIRKLLVNPLDKQYKKRFTVRIGQHIKMIPTEDIVCFYSENKGTYIHTTGNRDYLMDCTLEQLEEKTDPLKFFRISRKYLIHIGSITDIISYTNSRLQLKLEHFNAGDIIVSREKVKSFKNWLE